MRMFVTGATGFIGQALIPRLQRDGYAVVAWVRSPAASGGDDFLARLCRRWESAAQDAERLGPRVVLLRTGVVLGRAGGALAQMLPPFQES